MRVDGQSAVGCQWTHNFMTLGRDGEESVDYKDIIVPLSVECWSTIGRPQADNRLTVDLLPTGYQSLNG